MKWKNLKQRLGLKGILCCCLATWRRPQITETIPVINAGRQAVLTPTTSSAMNLAMALAEERSLRNVGKHGVVKTLMRLIEETDGVDEWKEEEIVGGRDWVCCVCMDRDKGAALVPCGHTFCRICSRELRANRGSCPLCNSSILEILHIFG